MSMVGADIDHDRSLQCGVEQLGDAIGLVIVRPRSSAEGSDRPRFAHRLPEPFLDPGPGQMRLDVASRRSREGGASSGIHHQLRSEEHTTELQSLMRTSYAGVCLKTKK